MQFRAMLWVAFIVARVPAAISNADEPVRGVKPSDVRPLVGTRSVRGMGAFAVYSPDGRSVIESFEKDVRVWDLSRGQVIRQVQNVAEYGVSSVVCSPDGMTLATTGWDSGAKWQDSSGIHIWSLATGLELPRLENAPPGNGCVAFSPDGSLLAATGYRTVYLWSVANRKLVRRIDDWKDGIAGSKGTGAYRGVFFSSDGKFLTAVRHGLLRTWSIDSGERVRTIEGLSEGDYLASRSANGKRTLFGSAEKLVVYASESGGALRTFIPFSHEAIAICSVSPDGDLVGFAAHDTIQIWNSKTGDEVARVRLPIPADAFYFWINSVTFSPDGNDIVIAARDGSVRIVTFRNRH